MATMSVTSNDGALGSASAVLEISATNSDFNQPALRIKQAGQRGGAASIRIDDPNPILSSSRPNRIQTIRQRESTRLRSSPTSSRSMAGMRLTLASRRSSLSSGWRRAAISVSEQAVNLVGREASSRLLMPLLRPR
jgi:hypothetical protein